MIQDLIPIRLSNFEFVLGGKGIDVDTVNRLHIDLNTRITYQLSVIFYHEKFLHWITSLRHLEVSQLPSKGDLLACGLGKVPFQCGFPKSPRGG